MNVKNLLVEQLDALFFRHFADEQRAVFLYHDVAVQSLDDHFLLLRGVYDAIVRIVEVDVIAYALPYLSLGVCSWSEIHEPRSLHPKAEG